MRTWLGATSLALVWATALPAAGPPAANPKGALCGAQQSAGLGWNLGVQRQTRSRRRARDAPVEGQIPGELPGLAEDRQRESRRSAAQTVSYCRPPGNARDHDGGPVPRPSSCSRRVASPRTMRRGCRCAASGLMAASTRRIGIPLSMATRSATGQGTTLVVDTVGIKTITELRNGMPHSEQLHVIEKIHLDEHDPNTLVDDLTAEDPLALAKPWHTVPHLCALSRPGSAGIRLCRERPQPGGCRGPYRTAITNNDNNQRESDAEGHSAGGRCSRASWPRSRWSQPRRRTARCRQSSWHLRSAPSNYARRRLKTGSPTAAALSTSAIRR